MIKLFEQYNEYSQVKEWLDEWEIKNYIINGDLTVDVAGNVMLKGYELTEIPVKFGRVTGTFNCNYNNLTSLKGCPKEVDENFCCSNNQLTTLEDCPKEIGGFFDCSWNKLTSLKYAPKRLGDQSALSCGNNPLPLELLSIIGNIVIDKIIIFNQEEYGIWNSDGSLNKGRWDILLKDIRSGILN